MDGGRWRPSADDPGGHAPPRLVPRRLAETSHFTFLQGTVQRRKPWNYRKTDVTTVVRRFIRIPDSSMQIYILINYCSLHFDQLLYIYHGKNYPKWFTIDCCTYIVFHSILNRIIMLLSIAFLLVKVNGFNQNSDPFVNTMLYICFYRYIYIGAIGSFLDDDTKKLRNLELIGISLLFTIPTCKN